MKSILIKLILIFAVIGLCFIFAMETPFWNADKINSIENMQSDDITLTIIDNDTVKLENNIKGSNLLYSWNIYNTVYDSSVKNTESYPLPSNDVIEIRYEDISDLSFQASIVYDGIKYTSNLFIVDSNGTISLSQGDDLSEISDEGDFARDINDIVSIAFICFLVISLIAYYLVPKKIQWCVLLAASTIFYLISGVEYFLFLFTSTLVAFFSAKLMTKQYAHFKESTANIKDKKEKKELKAKLKRKNKNVLIIAFIVVIGILAVIKYSSFILTNVNNLIGINIPIITLLMPLGLSFYTFIIIAYLVDVSRGKYNAEKNFLKFMLFTSFFPHVSQGPISRYNELMPQLQSSHKFDYKQLCFGAQRILWGFFIKLVLADRLATFVNAIFDNYTEQSWLMLVIGCFAFSIQIYADFYSSMEIVIGAAQTFGIKLNENFLRPYFSKDMPEFWRRWHVTLGSWFKDYVFYPIATSKILMKFNMWAKKRIGVHVAMILVAMPPVLGVWILTGLWHGASWNFVAWGLFHGILIALSIIFATPVENRIKSIGINVDSTPYHVIQIIKVFLLCSLGRIFFRASTIQDAFNIISSIFLLKNPLNNLICIHTIDLSIYDYLIIIFSVFTLFVVSCVQEKKGYVRDIIFNTNLVVRWFIWIALICSVLVLGIYGPGNLTTFVYEAF